jgi:hypothetical protein
MVDTSEDIIICPCSFLAAGLSSLSAEQVHDLFQASVLHLVNHFVLL